PPHGPPPRRGQPGDRYFPRPAGGPVGPAPVDRARPAGEAGPVPVLPDRARARPPRSRDRRGAAAGAPRRPDRLAGPAAPDRLAATPRRDGAPSVGVPRQRGGAHRRAGRRARP